MIAVKATLTIVADDDDAVDEVYQAIHPFDEGWPGRVVTVIETSREALQ